MINVDRIVGQVWVHIRPQDDKPNEMHNIL